MAGPEKFEMTVAQRKSAILTCSTLPCLSDCHAINLTAGCAFRCRYCYAQGYSNNPGGGRITFYANSAQKLEVELSRKKHKPKTVYFSTATDPFIPDRQVLDSQFQIMDMLLKNRIPLLISTKAKIPERFVELFSEHRDLVVVQIGQTTIDDRVRALMEPKAAPVSDRLRNIAVLAARNVTTELRMDPLIPWLTDTDRSLRALLLEAASRGCRQAVASFLHVRKANRAAMAVESGAWDFEKMRRHLYTETAKLGNDGCEMLLPSARYRRQRFDAISQMAEEFGIAVRFCGCKNPDMVLAENHAEPKKPAEPLSLNPGRHHDPVAEWLCHPWQASEPAQSGQLPLFY